MMTEAEFNFKRQWGWNPPSPEEIPLFLPGEVPDAVSSELVTGYFWREEALRDIQEIGEVLDYFEEAQPFGRHGARPAAVYGAGYLYTHRDPVETLLLWDTFKRGSAYQVTGYAFERLNTGIISWGSLDMTERIFPLPQIKSWRKLSREELAAEPTLYRRICRTWQKAP